MNVRHGRCVCRRAWGVGQRVPLLQWQQQRLRSLGAAAEAATLNSKTQQRGTAVRSVKRLLLVCLGALGRQGLAPVMMLPRGVRQRLLLLLQSQLVLLHQGRTMQLL
jgi:hypothetical protein